jgi:hypothetical protein
LASLLQTSQGTALLPWVAFALGLVGGFGLGVTAARLRVPRPPAGRGLFVRGLLSWIPLVVAALLWGVLCGVLIARFLGA